MSKTGYSFPEATYVKPDNIPLNVRVTPHLVQRLSTTITYTNKTQQTVYVLTRDGVTTSFPPASNIISAEQRFEVYKYTNYNGVNFNIPTLLDGDSKYQQSIDKSIYAEQEAFDNKPGSHRGWSSDRYLQHGIDIATLLERKSLYLPNLDVVITIESPNSGITHPLTLHGECADVFHRAFKPFNMTCMTSFNILLIDNEDAIGARYINISGKVIRVLSVKDTTRPSGLYIFDMKKGVIEPPRIYPLDDLNSSGYLFFASYEEAYSGGSPKAIFEKEIAANKLEMEQYAQDLSNKKREYEEEFLKLKQKIERETLETKMNTERELNDFKIKELRYREKIQQLDQENLTFKRDTERQAQRRRETIEELKWAAGILAATLTAIGIIVKHLKSE
jgi:hypothetical protein